MAAAEPPAYGGAAFADPNYNGSCDPEVVWNSAAGEWWAFYTGRRATREQGTYVGNPIGVAASKDLRTWRFVGYCSFDGVKGKPDNPDTRWAPGVVRLGDAFHMYVTYKDSARPPWGGKGRIRHYVAPVVDLLDGWSEVAPPDFPQPDPIDATLLVVGEELRAYYRVGKGGGIQWSSCPASSTGSIAGPWTHHGKCPGDVNKRSVHGHNYQEAPYAFRLSGAYWLITDPHAGLAVYRSEDAVTWTYQGLILDEPGSRPQDGTLARHPSVAVSGDRAVLVYHVEPNRPYPTPPAEQRTVRQKLSYLQVAELAVVDGKLNCDRDKPVEPVPPPAD
ncbi:MAG: family 43 glycosylhydrolase [Planctomycetota bacterium]